MCGKQIYIHSDMAGIELYSRRDQRGYVFGLCGPCDHRRGHNHEMDEAEIVITARLAKYDNDLSEPTPYRYDRYDVTQLDASLLPTKEVPGDSK